MKKPDLRGRVPESWACIDCGINTAPGMLNREQMEQAFVRDWNDQGVNQIYNELSEVYTVSSFVIDGEAVLLGVDGRSDFNGLHSRKHDNEVQFYAFNMLVSDGDDVRKLPLSMRKASLSRLLARRVDGIFLSDFEQGEIGPDLFRHACLMGLEGLVSKLRDRPYRPGRSPS